MKVALYQNSPVFGDIGRNLAAVIKQVENENFDLLVLPELFATGYQFRDRQEALSMADDAGRGETFNTLKNLAGRKSALITYGFPEIKGKKLFNSAAAILPNGEYRIYQKTHLFNTEKRIFDPGESGFFIFPFHEAMIGLMICFDWRFPESARTLSLLGADIICHPFNLVLPNCPEAMITRALENGVFTITADRVGVEDRVGQGIRFIGKSRIVDPDGRILGELGTENPGFLCAEIDPIRARNKKITPENDLLADRRPEFYRK